MHIVLQRVNNRPSVPSSKAEQQTHNLLVVGSTPTGPTMPVSQRQQAKNMSEQEKVEPQKQTTVVCIACGDTGKNSKDGVCTPCEKSGRIGVNYVNKTLTNPLDKPIS